MQFTNRDLQAAINELSMCEYFPSEAGARGAIQLLLARMCPDREALEWLVREFVDRIGKWHGPVELRGILCTRYKPADGIEASSSLPGYRPEDAYERHLEQHAQRKCGGWLEGAEGRAPELPMTEESMKLLEAAKTRLMKEIPS